MMMITVIMIVVFRFQFFSSTTYSGKFSQDKEIHEDQRLQSVGLPLISNHLTLGHMPLDLSSSEMDANTIEALSSTIPDYEMQALKDLYDSTDGDNWRWASYDGRWVFTNGNANPCATDYDTTWSGLTCTSKSSNDLFHVTSIDLRWHYYLNGTLPDSLGQLSELKYLRLDSESPNRQLFGSIPASLSVQRYKFGA
jgi:hypothetical protein